MKQLFTGLIFLCTTLAMSQVSFTLKPGPEKGKDAMTHSAPQYTTVNYGDHFLQTISAWTFDAQFGRVRTLFDIDLSLLPPNAVVLEAKAKFYANSGQNNNQEYHSNLGGSNESWIERITSNWDEHLVTYNNEPTTTTENRISVPVSDSINHDFVIDITALVNDYLLNPNGSFGFMWKLQTELSYRRLGFCSSDYKDPSKWPEFTITYTIPGVSGSVFHDLNKSCDQQANEFGLANRLIEIQPGNHTVQTNDAGIWHVAGLSPGNYTATLLTSSEDWKSTCPLVTTFEVLTQNESLVVPGFGIYTSNECPEPNISIYSNILRRCFSEQEIYVSASNSFTATQNIDDAYAEITLDPLFTLDSASLAYTALGDNVFKFELDTLAPSETVQFTMYVTLSCNAVLLETLCHKAELFPIVPCVLDTIPIPFPPTVTPCDLPWDKSSLVVDGWCQNDSIYFTVTNHGSGSMDCYAPVRVYIDGVLTTIDSIRLVSGETMTYTFAGDGRTWILQADQHPLHPGHSRPNAHVELCGDALNWTPDVISDFPTDDADPVIDIFCTVTNGAYDPNDKRGFPSGLTEKNFILPNQELEYIIRFQNTGTDTAFTVVVRDTLDQNLDISSIKLGNSSHNYTFRIYGQRILEWRFDNILLVDSTMNEPKSHGFIQFKVNQRKDLPNGTMIDNEVGIYFDFNDPVITNTAHHEINNRIQIDSSSVGLAELNPFADISIYPNPVEEYLTIELKDYKEITNYKLHDLTGKKLRNGIFTAQQGTINMKELKSGIYILTLESQNVKKSFRIAVN